MKTVLKDISWWSSIWFENDPIVVRTALSSNLALQCTFICSFMNY